MARQLNDPNAFEKFVKEHGISKPIDPKTTEEFNESMREFKKYERARYAASVQSAYNDNKKVK